MNNPNIFSMKKVIFIISLFLSVTTICKAQNSLSMALENGICVTNLTAYYEDESSENLTMGCSGNFNFSTGDKVVRYVCLNGTICNINEETFIIADDGATVNVKIIKTGNANMDNVNGLIR